MCKIYKAFAPENGKVGYKSLKGKLHRCHLELQCGRKEDRKSRFKTFQTTCFPDSSIHPKYFLPGSFTLSLACCWQFGDCSLYCIWILTRTDLRKYNPQGLDQLPQRACLPCRKSFDFHLLPSLCFSFTPYYERTTLILHS